jgi:hypothetical protein
MAITIVPLRKGSRGIQGSYANANHHAKACVPIIKQMESILTALGDKFDFVWSQGHNVHLVHRVDGATLTFRPCVTESGLWGIDVLTKFSRSQEMRLFTMLDIADCFDCAKFLANFLLCGKNVYGTINQNGRSNEFLATEAERVAQ